MNANILLVNPPIYDFAAYDLFNKPLGLLYIGALLRRCGYQVRLVDALDRFHPVMQAKFGPVSVKANGTGKYHSEIIGKPSCLEHIPRHYRRYGMPREVLKELLQYEYDCHRPVAVLVTSMMSYWYPAVADTIHLAREVMPKVPLALGGVYASLFPEHARRICKPDKLFVGNDLRQVVEWVAAVTGKLAGKCGFSSQQSEEQVYSPQMPGNQVCSSKAGKKSGLNHQNWPLSTDAGSDFTQWPAPAYDLYGKLNYLTVITSLGCPFHCDYCASRYLQPYMQQMSPERFVEQLAGLLPLLDNQPGGTDAVKLSYNADRHTGHIDRNTVYPDGNTDHSDSNTNHADRNINHTDSNTGNNSSNTDELKGATCKCNCSTGMTEKRYNIAFMDDALLARAGGHIVRILHLVGQMGQPFHFYTPNGLHCRYITAEIADLLRANRFEMVRLSYEASDSARRWQLASDDKVTDSDFQRAVRLLLQAGYPPSELDAYILIGLPGQTLSEVRESALRVHDMNVKVRLCQFSPIPGTGMFQRACEFCGIDPSEPLLHNNSLLPGWNHWMGWDEFQSFKAWIQELNQSVTGGSGDTHSV